MIPASFREARVFVMAEMRRGDLLSVFRLCNSLKNSENAEWVESLLESAAEEAISSGDVLGLQKLLDEGLIPSENVFQSCVRSKHPEPFDFWVENGFPVSSNGLDISVSYGYLDRCEKLLSLNFDFNGSRILPLLIDAQGNGHDIAGCLLAVAESRIVPDEIKSVLVSDDYRSQLLFSSLQHGKDDMVNDLLKMGATLSEVQHEVCIKTILSLKRASALNLYFSCFGESRGLDASSLVAKSMVRGNRKIAETLKDLGAKFSQESLSLAMKCYDRDLVEFVSMQVDGLPSFKSVFGKSKDKSDEEIFAWGKLWHETHLLRKKELILSSNKRKTI